MAVRGKTLTQRRAETQEPYRMQHMCSIKGVLWTAVSTSLHEIRQYFSESHVSERGLDLAQSLLSI